MRRASVTRPGAPSSRRFTLVPCETRTRCSSRRRKRHPSRSASASDGVEVAARLECGERDLGLGRSYARVVAVAHLEPLRRELDVDDPPASHLEIVARRGAIEPLVPELSLHA